MAKRQVLEGWIHPYHKYQEEQCPKCEQMVLWPNPQGIEGVDVADDREPLGRLLSSLLKSLGHRRVRVTIELVEH